MGHLWLLADLAAVIAGVTVAVTILLAIGAVIRFVRRRRNAARWM